MRTKHVLAPAEARRLMKVAVLEAKRLKLEVGITASDETGHRLT
jgi:uncharacterized protein GlcG (DUF336 family)